MKPTVAVIGTGPVGLLFATSLQRSGIDTLLVGRSQQRVDTYREFGVTTYNSNGDRDHVSLPHVCGIDAISTYDQVSTILLCVKGPQVLPVMESSVLPRGCKILSVQNGLGAEDEIASFVGTENVSIAVLNFGVNAPADGVIYPSKLQTSYISSMAQEGEVTAQRMAGVLTNAGIPFSVSEDFTSLRWKKVILNAVVSPVCTVFNLNIREALESATARAMMGVLFKEAMNVAVSAKVNLDRSLSEEYLLQWASSFGAHRPSMMKDIATGVPTEIANINGKIVSIGRHNQVPTPAHEQMVDMIADMEQKGK